MKSTTIGLLATAGAIGIAAVTMLGAAPSATGSKAPAFTAGGSDGKTHTLASLTKDGPIVLYFISSTCPVNEDAEKYFNRIGAAYGKGVRLFGVINEDAAGAKQWSKEFKPTYRLLYDPRLKIINDYKAEASPWAVLVKDGEIAKVWEGYSNRYLTELNAAVAQAGKTPAKKIDLKGAPVEPAYG